jgi:hypothetical protein
MLPDGSLAAELPSLNGARRQVPVESLETIRRILAAQLSNRASTIGTDGKPTQSQVIHWERHLETFNSRGETTGIKKLDPDNCIWCLAHSLGIDTSERAQKRARAILREQRRAASHPFSMGDGSVTVRRIPKRDRRISGKERTETIVMDFDEDDFAEALNPSQGG